MADRMEDGAGTLELPDGGTLGSSSSARPDAGEEHAAAGSVQRWKPGALPWIVLAVVALDQITKALVRASLPLHASVEVIPGFLDFTHVRNTGAAFGMFNTLDFAYKAAVVAGIRALALVAIASYGLTLSKHEVLARFGLALIVGGAAGNLIDGLFLGSVVDFVDAYWRTYHFWAFNVADSAITIGVAVMILDILGVRTHASHPV